MSFEQNLKKNFYIYNYRILLESKKLKRKYLLTYINLFLFLFLLFLELALILNKKNLSTLQENI